MKMGMGRMQSGNLWGNLWGSDRDSGVLWNFREIEGVWGQRGLYMLSIMCEAQGLLNV